MMFKKFKRGGGGEIERERKCLNKRGGVEEDLSAALGLSLHYLKVSSELNTKKCHVGPSVK